MKEKKLLSSVVLNKILRVSVKPLFLILIFFAIYILFVDLGKATLDNWDEAWYGEMIKEMLRTKEFIYLQWNHTLLLDKPPLLIWLNALVSSVIGLSEFSVRFISAVSGFIIIVLVFLHSYKKWGIVPSLVTFSTITLNNVFIARARSGNIDVFVTLLIFISYFLILSNRKNKYIFLGIIFAGIYLAKTSLVLFPFSIFIFHEFLFRREQLKDNMFEYLKLLIIFLGISGVWLFLGYLKIGSQFVTYYLFYSDQGVSHVTLANMRSTYFDYAYYALQRRFYYFFVVGIVFLAIRIKKPVQFLIFFFSLSLLALLSLSSRNNNWYLIPSMPFWSLAIAYGIYKILKLLPYKPYFATFIILVTIYISYKTFTINIIPILHTYSTLDQAESGVKIKELSKENEIIVRLDHLYPATIYYSDRKVLASPTESDTRTFWISRKDLVTRIKKKNIKWLVGTTEEVEQFMHSNKDLFLEIISVNKTESIIKAS